MTTGKRKVHSLIDKVWDERNLLAAWERVRANGGCPGSDGETLERFEANLEANLKTLSEELRGNRYQPRPVLRVNIPKESGGERPLGIPSVRDRVVQAALMQKLAPIFEPCFSDRSYGFRPGRGTKDALSQLYGRVLDLIRRFLQNAVLEEGRLRDVELGTPQGGVLSPLLANIYLHGLDQRLAEAGISMVRYAREKTLARFQEKVRYLTRRHQNGPLGDVVRRLNPVLRGWGNHYAKAHVQALFFRLHRWVCWRLRAFVAGRWRNLAHRWLSNAVLEERYGLVALPALALKARLPRLAGAPATC